MFLKCEGSSCVEEVCLASSYLKSAVKCRHFHYAGQSMLLLLVNPVTQVSLCVDCAYICAFLFYSILF